MNVVVLMPLLSAVLVIVLGVFIFIKDIRNIVNILYLLFSISIFIWLFGTYMMFISQTHEVAFYWDKFVYIGVVFIPALIYHFGVTFIGKARKRLLVIILGYILSLAFLYLNTQTKLFIDGINEYSWGIHSKAQLFHHVFLVFFIFYVGRFFVEGYLHYKQSSGIAKEQAKYLLIALLTLAAGSLAFLPAYGLNVYPIAYVSGLLFSIILAYTIIRHRLLAIRFVLRKSSVYGASLFTILILVGFTKYYIGDANFYIISQPWVDFVILIIAILVFPALKKYIHQYKTFMKQFRDFSIYVR